MDERIYTIDLGNGTILEDLILNGNCYVSQEEVTEETFDGMEDVTITDSEGGTQEMYNVELTFVNHFADGYYFGLNEMTETQLKALSTDAQVMYTALMTDTLIEEV